MISVEENPAILQAVNTQFFMFTTAHLKAWVVEGCYVITGTTLQGCSKTLSDVLPKQKMLLEISLTLNIEGITLTGSSRTCPKSLRYIVRANNAIDEDFKLDVSAWLIRNQDQVVQS